MRVLVAGALLSALLAGCAATPTVTYRSMAERPRRDDWVAQLELK